LDRFNAKPRVSFSLISLILVGLVALIGPLDYLLITRVLGKPLLGWLTFPISVAIASVLLLAIGQRGKSQSAENASAGASLNRIEVVDIDAASSTPLGRGWSWSHLYCNDAAITDYAATVNEALVGSKKNSGILSAPFGYPGSTFGGISIAGEDKRQPGYRVLMTLDGNAGLVSEIKNVPLPPGGSKSVASRWTFKPTLKGTSDLARRRGSELLEGKLTNPLSVDVLNGALVYGEWVYLLPTRFRSGETIESIDTLRQKNFRWLLARREALENSSRSEPWNAEMYDDLPRLAEILTFDSVVGGREYTGLANRPLHDLDLGYLLRQDRAILYGELENAALDIDLPVQRDSASTVRVVLPVSSPRLK